jgi:hypothetical protein
MLKNRSAAIATMTRARNQNEAELLYCALSSLARLGVRIFVTDDPTSVPEFTQAMKKLPNVRLQQGGHSLAQRIKWSLRRAMRHADFVIYTEPDKKDFFEKGIEALLHQAQGDEAVLTIAARDESSLATFPDGQRWTESSFAELANRLLGPLPDLLYGPLAFQTRSVGELIEQAPEDVGWGWRTYVVARCALAKLKIASYSTYLPCPHQQSGEDGKNDRVYRLQQLIENIRGLRLALMDSSFDGDNALDI